MSWFREWLQGGGDAASTSDGAGSSTAGVGSSPAGVGSAPRARPHARSAAGEGAATAGPVDPGHPGERFGLPETGPGSVATLARRGAQFALDVVLAGLVAALFTYPALPQNWSLLSWAILMVVPVAVIGMTPAMVMLGMRVVRLDRPESPGVGLLWTVVRTASVFFVVPALIIDRDSRGVHDRASRTIVIRTR